MSVKRLLFLALTITQLSASVSTETFYSNTWVLHTAEGKDYVDLLAEKHGFINRREIEGFPGYYLLEHKTLKRTRRTVSEHTLNLSREPHVTFVEHQKVLRRTKRDFLDPLFSDQWYLQNSGQTPGPQGFDINVEPVWKKNITGRGVVVTILDDGIEYTHVDLKRNYEQKASYDFNGNDKDPFPRYSRDNINKHGTRCAGEVAADINNGACGVGVAFNSRIGGVRMLDGDVTDAVEGSSLSVARDVIDIYSSSWGPDDDGRTVDGPGPMARRAFRDGIRKGRNGLGAIFVWATGNGGHHNDYCSCDGYITSIFTVSIGAVNDRGKSPWYAESCPATLAVTYSSGQTRGPDKQIVTTDLHNQCTKSHTGTSAAAPLAAGIFALVLEANPKLTWRDLQHLIVNTSKQIDEKDGGWQRNGAGHLVNNKFGFGTLDSAALVEAATSPNWKTAGEHHVCRDLEQVDNAPLKSRGTFTSFIKTTGCLGKTNCVTSLEHVRVYISLSHRRRGSLRIRLTSPQGTTSELLAPRDQDSGDGFQNWPFMSVFHWGENPMGMWTLQVIDTKGFSGTFKRWSLRLYGTCTQTSVTDPNEEEHCAQYCTKNCTQPFAKACPKCSCYCHCGTGKCVKLCNVSDKVDQEKKECWGDVHVDLSEEARSGDPLDEDDSTFYEDPKPTPETLTIPTASRNSHSLSMFMKLLIIFILVAILLSSLLLLWLCKGSRMLCWAKQIADKEAQKNVAYRPVADSDRVDVTRNVAYRPETVTPEVNDANLQNLGNLYHVQS